MSAGFNVHVIKDAQSLVWGKLVINAAINPLTALLKIPNGELLNRPSAREMMGRLAREVAEVALAEEIRLPFERNRAGLFKQIRADASRLCAKNLAPGRFHREREASSPHMLAESETAHESVRRTSGNRLTVGLVGHSELRRRFSMVALDVLAQARHGAGRARGDGGLRAPPSSRRTR